MLSKSNANIKNDTGSNPAEKMEELKVSKLKKPAPLKKTPSLKKQDSGRRSSSDRAEDDFEVLLTQSLKGKIYYG